MKKFLLSLVALMTFGVSAWADGVTVEDVIIRKGKSASAFVTMTTDAAFYSGFSFDLVLPEGITCSEMTFQQIVKVGDQEVAVDVTGPKGIIGSDVPASAAFVVTSNYVNKEEPQTLRFVCYSGAGNPINTAAGDFIVLEIPLNATGATLKADDVLSATMNNIHFSTAGSKDVVFDDASFNIKVADKYLVLYDTETEAPAAAENEDVKVVRTLKADVWNTICLPFALTEEQVNEAFGEGVQIADFVGCEGDAELSGTALPDYCTSVKVKFEPVVSMEANRPYLIKISETITEFTVDGVDIVTNADEDGLVYIEKDEYKYTIKKKDYFAYDTFYGTYVAATEVPEGSIFLSNNKFMASTGNSYVNAFRGYFTFDVYNIDPTDESGVKFSITLDDETSIENIDGISTNVEGMYDISGRKLNEMPKTKGVYVINGKKVAIK